MATKLPLELQVGDRLVVRQGRRTGALAAVAFAQDSAGLYVRLEDDTQVMITDLSVPVEVSL